MPLIKDDKQSKLILSVDLDMWWHCRWATGGPDSVWPNIGSLLEDCYGNVQPSQELADLTREVLALFDLFQVKSTFFILGQVAEWFPYLVREIAARGHEVACHGWRHVDATLIGRNQFREEVGEAKKLLSELSGQPVLGYRAPNLVITDWMFEELINLGFQYDSSICPARKFFGKFSQFAKLPNNAFQLRDMGLTSKSLVEIPIPVMPLVKIPAASGIISRILGGWWSRLALAYTLKGGHALYYFHPYEIGPVPKLPRQNMYVRLFLRNLGPSYYHTLTKMLRWGNKLGVMTAQEACQELN